MSTDIAEKAGEVAGEVVEETVDGVIDVAEVVYNNPKVAIAAGIGGSIVGGVVGYFVARKRLESFYAEQASVDIEEAKVFYRDMYRVNDDGTARTPEDILRDRHGDAAVAEAVRSYQGHPDEEPVFQGEPHDEVVDDEIADRLQAKAASDRAASIAGKAASKIENSIVATHNTFVDDNFDHAEEMKLRTHEKPYIITHDEFYDPADGIDETAAYTYYEVDKVLADERDQPVENVDAMIGEEHLARFGHGSKDRNVVFVRNERLGMDFEIARSAGSYLEEVLGDPTRDPHATTIEREKRRNTEAGAG